MKNKSSLYQQASQVSGSGRLQSQTEDKQEALKKTKSKSLASVPIHYFDLHKELKDTNKTNLDFSNYILEALREKLARDGVL